HSRCWPGAASVKMCDWPASIGSETAACRAAPDALGSMLARDIDALAFLRFPQIPSSRAWGDAPVVDVAEYRARLTRDRSKMKIVPVPARPFPDELRDDDLRPPPVPPSRLAAIVWGTLALLSLPVILVLD